MTKRLIMQRKPARLPIGSVRRWAAGTFTKVSKTRWVRISMAENETVKPPPVQALAASILASLPKEAAKDTGGLAQLARTLATAGKADEEQVRSLAASAARELERLEARAEEPELKWVPVLPLPKAVAHIVANARDDMAWMLYCARRLAFFNDGKVDMLALPMYAHKAAAYHSGQLPPETPR